MGPSCFTVINEQIVKHMDQNNGGILYIFLYKVVPFPSCHKDDGYPSALHFPTLYLIQKSSVWFKDSFIFTQQFSIWFHWRLLYILQYLPLLHNVCKFVFYLSFRVKIRLRLSGLCYFWSRDQLSSVTLKTGQECSELNLIGVRRNDFCYTLCYTMFGSSSC